MDSKQLAVDWLVEKIKAAKPDFKFDALIREAKEMEKEQIIEAYEQGESEWTPFEFNTAQDYYTSSYGK
jgi:hypothetical protein